MRSFWCEVRNVKVLLWIVEWGIFAANCGIRSFCCELWNETFLLQIVEWEFFAVNCGMRSFCCEVFNEMFCCLLWTEKLCLSHFQLGTSPGQPQKNFFERGRPGHWGKFCCLIPCPGAKNEGRIPRGSGKSFPNSKKLLRIKLAKVLKKIKKTTRQQNHSKVFKYSSLDIQLKQWIYSYIH